MIGFNVTNEDLTCRGFQYSIGDVFTVDGEIEPCGNGLDFCEKEADVWNHYSQGRVFEVEALGEVITEGDKTVTNKLKIVKEVTYSEEYWLAAVQRDVDALRYVPTELRSEKLCLAAVQQDGYALRYVPTELRSEKLCLAAVQRDVYALEYIPTELRSGILEKLGE